VRDELDRRRAASSGGPKKPARELLAQLSDDLRRERLAK